MLSDQVIQSPSRTIKQRWTLEEDQMLREAVAASGPHNWHLLAEHLPNRNEKQCRERWMNQLRPDVCKAEWTPTEDARILQLYNQLGSAWAEIAKILPGRSDQMVKNRFNNHLRAAWMSDGQPAAACRERHGSGVATPMLAFAQPLGGGGELLGSSMHGHLRGFGEDEVHSSYVNPWLLAKHPSTPSCAQHLVFAVPIPAPRSQPPPEASARIVGFMHMVCAAPATDIYSPQHSPGPMLMSPYNEDSFFIGGHMQSPAQQLSSPTSPAHQYQLVQSAMQLIQ